MMTQKIIEEFIHQLSFKKRVIGGCDEEDVFLKMQQLSALYREQIQELENQLAFEKERSSALKQELENQLAFEKEHSNALNRELEAIRSQKNGYSEQSEQLSNLINNIERSKEHILQSVRGKALQEAEELNREIQVLKCKKDSLNYEITETTSSLSQALDSVQEKMISLRKQIGDLQPRKMDTENAV